MIFNKKGFLLWGKHEREVKTSPKKSLFSRFASTVTRPARRLFGKLSTEELVISAQKKLAKHGQYAYGVLTDTEEEAIKVHNKVQYQIKLQQNIANAQAIYQKYPAITRDQLAKKCQRGEGYVVLTATNDVHDIERKIYNSFLNNIGHSSDSTLPIFLSIQAKDFTSDLIGSRFAESKEDKFLASIAVTFDASLRKRQQSKRAVITIIAIENGNNNSEFMVNLSRTLAHARRQIVLRLE